MARAGSVPRFRGMLGAAAWPAEAVARPAGVAAATSRAPSSLSLAAVAAAGEAPVARAGSVFRFCGVLGVAAWSAEALARPAGAAVATPRAPFSLSSAAAAALGDAPGSCAGATPRVGSVPGAAAWLAQAAVSASCASAPPPPPGAGRRGLLLGRRGRTPRLAQAPGPAAAARPAPPPPPVSAPRASRGSPPSTLERQGSGSGTGGGGGRPAGGSHRSLPSLLSW